MTSASESIAEATSLLTELALRVKGGVVLSEEEVSGLKVLAVQCRIVRDLHIYHSVLGGATQKQMARVYGISEGRVSQIISNQRIDSKKSS